MKNYRFGLFLALVFFSANTIFAQTTIAEKLGFEKDAKLLIIHADDAGMCNSENMATEAAFDKGAISSTSIMMPCPWSDDFIAWALKHPDADVGIHLTLTAEWEHYRWKGILQSDKIPSLLDKDGYLPHTSAEVVKQANLKEVEVELRAQIERAIALGIKPSHLDTHMAVPLLSSELIHLYIKLGKVYNIPVMLSRRMVNKYDLSEEEYSNVTSVIENLLFLKGLPSDKWEKEYRPLFENMKPGLGQLIFHLAFDNEEIQAITVNHTVANSTSRQNDYDFITSELFQSMLKEYNIHVIKWGDIQKVLYK